MSSRRKGQSLSHSPGPLLGRPASRPNKMRVPRETGVLLHGQMARETQLILSESVDGKEGILKENISTPIFRELFLPLVKTHLIMNVPWKCIFFINRSTLQWIQFIR